MLFFLLILEIVCAAYGLYVVLTSFDLASTQAIDFSVSQSRTRWNEPVRFGRSRADFVLNEYAYHYKIGTKNFEGTRISNMVIFPSDFDPTKNDNVEVFYVTYFPQFSMLVRPTLLYIFYNTLPLILISILFILEVAGLKHETAGRERKQKRKRSNI